MMKLTGFFALCGALVGVLPSCARMPGVAPERRPVAWAEAIEMDGVPNFHRVSGKLYRSAQPTAEGMRNLEKAGFGTVVNLRYFNCDGDEVEGTGLRAVRLRTLTWDPEEGHVDEFLRVVSEAEDGPVLVHCAHGSDRTGAMCSLYRVRAQGWSVDDAVEEMLHGGYGFHCVWKHLPGWVREQAAVGG